MELPDATRCLKILAVVGALVGGGTYVWYRTAAAKPSPPSAAERLRRTHRI